MKKQALKLGLCGIGLKEYWPQFEGLRERLDGYVQQLGESLKHWGVEVETFGLVDSAQRGIEIGHACKRAGVDFLAIYVTTYALSNTVLPMVQRAKVPVLVLNLQPEPAINYETFNRISNRTAMTGEWLAYCSACPVPEIINVLLRAGIDVHQVTGILNNPESMEEIKEWLDAARVKKLLEENRLGLMGHYYSGMLDIMTDVTQISITFGSHIEHLEVDELTAIRATVADVDVQNRVATFRNEFDIQPDCSDIELERAARTSVALDQFVRKHELNSMAYYYKGTGVPENENTMSSVILGSSLLTANGIPIAGEYEIKNAIAMKILDSFGAGGSFTEYYAMDLGANHVLMGHDGPGHIAIAEGKIKVRSLQVYHGKVSKGLSVEMSVKHGPVTLLSVAEDPVNRFKLIVAQGESVPGELLHIGNTNSHYQFRIGALEFVRQWNAQGPAHHCAIGVDHLASKLNKLARLLNIPFVQVC